MEGTEIERLLVRLVGDGSSYQKMLNDAQSSTTAAAKHIEEAGKGIENISKNIQGFASTALSALGTLGATAWLKEAFAAFTEAEKVDAELGATLRANDRDVKVLQKDYQDWATMVEHATTMSDEAVKVLLKTAESFDLTGEAAKSAVKQAIGLGAATGNSAQAMISLTEAMVKGDIASARMFARLVRPLRVLKDDSQFVAKYQELVAAGFEVASEEANTAAGQIKQLNEVYGDLMETFGQIVAEGIKPVIGWIKQLVLWFQGLSKHVQTIIVSIAALTAGFLALSTAIGVAGLVFNTVFGGAGVIIGLVVTVGAAIGLWVSQLGGVEKAWKSVEEASAETIGRILSFSEDVVLGVERWLDSLGNVADVWPTIQAAASVAWDAISGFALDFWAQVQPVLNEISTAFVEMWTQAVPVLQDVARQVMEAWSGFDAGSTLIKGILIAIKVVSSIIYVISGTLLLLVQYAGLLLARIGEMGVAFQPIRNAIMDVVVALADQLLPLFQKLYQGGQAVFKGLTKAISDFGDWAGKVWKDIFGGATITWSDIKDVVVDALRSIEFGIRNFGDIMTKMWLTIAFKAKEAFIEVNWFFTQIMPAFGKHLIDLFAKVFTGIFQLGLDIFNALFKKLLENAANFLPTLIGVLKGDIKTEDLFKMVADQLDDAKKEMDKQIGKFNKSLPKFELPPTAGELGFPPKFDTEYYGLKKKLQDITEQVDNARAGFDFGKEMDELSKGFEDVQGTLKKIRAQRWFDFPLFHDMKKVKDDVVDFSSGLGKDAGKAVVKEFGKELKGMDAVIRGSFEHREFLESYFQQLEDIRRAHDARYMSEVERRDEKATELMGTMRMFEPGQVVPDIALPPIPAMPDITIPDLVLPATIDQILKGQIRGVQGLTLPPNVLPPFTPPPIVLPPNLNLPAGQPIVPEPSAIPGLIGMGDDERGKMVALLEVVVDHLATISGKPNLTIKTAGLG